MNRKQYMLFIIIRKILISYQKADQTKTKIKKSIASELKHHVSIIITMLPLIGLLQIRKRMYCRLLFEIFQRYFNRQAFYFL